MNFDLQLQKAKKARFQGEKPKSVKSPLFVGLLLILILSYVVYIPESQTVQEIELRVGDIAKEDIVVRKTLSVEDREMTESNRQKILANAVPIYEFNQQKSLDGEIIINDWFKFIKELRKDYLNGRVSAAQIREAAGKNFALELMDREIAFLFQSNLFGKIDWNRMLALIKNLEEKGILISKQGVRKNPEDLIQIVYENGDNAIVKVNQLYDLKDVREIIGEFLKNTKYLSSKEVEQALKILTELVPIDVSYSKALSNIQEKKILDDVHPYFINLKKGKIVLRRGDEITPGHLKLIRLINVEEGIKRREVSIFWLIFVILGLIFLFLWRFYSVNKIGGLNRQQLIWVTTATLLASAVIYRLSLFLFPLILKNVITSIELDPRVVFYSIPFGVGALIIAFLFNLHAVVIFSFMNAIISGIVCDWSFKTALFVLISNITVGFAIDYYQRLKRSSILKSGFFWLIPMNVFLIFIFSLTDTQQNWLQLSFYLIMGILSALFSTFIANFMIPLWEVIFKLVTDLKLVEITNLNLPVFREMLEKAPGTYHHSLMVASLAESAAQDIGLSPLLLRGMALYHDVGKTENPQFFTENFSIYEDPHTRMSPIESAKMIISHISSGVDRAEKLKLPLKIVEAINHHHGTKRVKFFYDKAKIIYHDRPEEFNEEIFQYPGEKPQEIEQAIIMIADQVEAASKSLSAPQDDEIKNVIEQVVAADIAENQFDECNDLTFKALKTVAASFYEKLTSIYHQRVAYPGFNFEKSHKDDHDHQ